VQANNVRTSQASSSGNLELNAFMPLIAESLLESLQLLANSVNILQSKCVEGITVNEAVCRRHVENSTAVLTALVDTIGYENAQKIAQASRDSNKTIRELVTDWKLMTAQKFDQLTSAEVVMRLGKPDKEADI
jgi:aspartate ammonia-lyase